MNKVESMRNTEENNQDEKVDSSAAPAPNSIPQQVLRKGHGTLLDVSFATQQNPGELKVWSYTLSSGSTIVAWRGTPSDQLPIDNIPPLAVTRREEVLFETPPQPTEYRKEIDESARDRRIRIAEVLFTIKNGHFPTVADTTTSFFNIHIPSRIDDPEGYKLAKLQITRKSNEVYAIRRQIGEFLLLDVAEKNNGPQWLQAVDNAVQNHPVLGKLTDDEQVGVLWGEKSLTELCEQTGLSYTEIVNSPLRITDPQIDPDRY